MGQPLAPHFNVANKAREEKGLSTTSIPIANFLVVKQLEGILRVDLRHQWCDGPLTEQDQVVINCTRSSVKTKTKLTNLMKIS